MNENVLDNRGGNNNLVSHMNNNNNLMRHMNNSVKNMPLLLIILVIVFLKKRYNDQLFFLKTDIELVDSKKIIINFLSLETIISRTLSFSKK